MPEKTFDPKIGAKKAAIEAGTSVAAIAIAAGAAALAQPEVASQIAGALGAVIPPPWGLLAVPTATALLHGLAKFGIDWAKRRPRVIGTDELAEARRNYTG